MLKKISENMVQFVDQNSNKFPGSISCVGKVGSKIN